MLKSVKRVILSQVSGQRGIFQGGLAEKLHLVSQLVSQVSQC